MVKSLRHTAVSITMAASVLSSSTPTALVLGKDDPDFKNEFGMRSVKCQVHLNSPGNPVVGFVFGNHENDKFAAEKLSNEFTSRLAAPGEGTKRHCVTQKKCTPNGAYDTNMNPV